VAIQAHWSGALPELAPAPGGFEISNHAVGDLLIDLICVHRIKVCAVSGGWLTKSFSVKPTGAKILAQGFRSFQNEVTEPEGH